MSVFYHNMLYGFKQERLYRLPLFWARTAKLTSHLSAVTFSSVSILRGLVKRTCLRVIHITTSCAELRKLSSIILGRIHIDMTGAKGYFTNQKNPSLRSNRTSILRKGHFLTKNKKR